MKGILQNSLRKLIVSKHVPNPFMKLEKHLESWLKYAWSYKRTIKSFVLFPAFGITPISFYCDDLLYISDRKARDGIVNCVSDTQILNWLSVVYVQYILSVYHCTRFQKRLTKPHVTMQCIFYSSCIRRLFSRYRHNITKVGGTCICFIST